jgi:hypothetical protein
MGKGTASTTNNVVTSRASLFCMLSVVTDALMACVWRLASGVESLVNLKFYVVVNILNPETSRPS